MLSQLIRRLELKAGQARSHDDADQSCHGISIIKMNPAGIIR